jgi:hypothetical protein
MNYFHSNLLDPSLVMLMARAQYLLTFIDDYSMKI